MPDLRKSIRRVKTAIVGGMLVVGLQAGLAAAAEWPLELSTETFGVLPEGQGMGFFYGRWEQVVRPQGGDLNITDRSMDFHDSTPPFLSLYKVLHTADNYVLVARRPTYPDGTQWTEFNILTAQTEEGQANRRDNLRMYSCAEPDLKRPEPFDWPAEKLLEFFKTSKCLARLYDKPTLYEFASFRWSSFRFQRGEIGK